MAMTNLTQHTFPNGLRLVHLRIERSFVGHFGVAVKAGSMDEKTPAEHGLAHFVEHTLFKGTLKRHSWHIINRMEAVGGELNAYTGKEDTVIYTTFPRGSMIRAVELVTDLVLNSQFPDKELDKEREVVCDEINSYRDSPADAVYDDFEDMLYADSTLGHNILGDVKSVRAITGSMCRQWLATHYVAEKMVAFYAGPMSAENFISKASPYLTQIPARKAAGEEQGLLARKYSPHFESVRHIDTHQAHTVMGCYMPRLNMEARVNMALVTNMLGGPGMNSLLNVVLRERRGLVYSVESSLSNLGDTTMFTTYFGTDPEDNNLCIRLVRETICKLADPGTDARKIAAAKKQYRGQLVLARENVENRIISLARAILLNGYMLSIAQTDELLASITPATVRQAALELANLSYLSFSP